MFFNLRGNKTTPINLRIYLVFFVVNMRDCITFFPNRSIDTNVSYMQKQEDKRKEI